MICRVEAIFARGLGALDILRAEVALIPKHILNALVFLIVAYREKLVDGNAEVDRKLGKQADIGQRRARFP